jgi:hypothetical protein
MSHQVNKITLQGTVEEVKSSEKFMRMKLVNAKGKYRTWVQAVSFSIMDSAVKTGDEITIEGSLQSYSYEKKTGEKVWALQIVFDSLSQVGGAKPLAQKVKETQAKEPEASISGDWDDDDIPF